MADLTDNQAAQTVKIIGSNSSGVEQTPVNSTTTGAMHTNLRDNLGNELGVVSNPIYINGNANILSPLPSITASFSRVLATQKTYYYTANIITNTAIKEFHFGGTGGGNCILGKYLAGNSSLLFGFNSTTEVSQWASTSLNPITFAYSTAQAFEGTGSVAVTFTQSDNNNYPELTYTYATPTDYTGWRYISGQFYQTVSTGGSVSRTISIRLTDVFGNIRVYQSAFTTTTTAGWQPILVELNNPSSQTGTTFDITQIASVKLRMVDGANRAGTVYWDAIKLVGQIDIVDKIYSSSGDTRQLNFDPIKKYLAGEVLILIATNTTAASNEYFASASGVDIT